MNRRLKKLAADAGYPDYMTYGQDKVLEKFAELIVRECMSVVNKRFMGDLNREDQEVRRCVEDIKNHFALNNE